MWLQWSYYHLNSHLNPILGNLIMQIQELSGKFFAYWTGEVSAAEPEFVTCGTNTQTMHGNISTALLLAPDLRNTKTKKNSRCQALLLILFR